MQIVSFGDRLHETLNLGPNNVYLVQDFIELKEKKTKEHQFYHQITHLTCFSVFIINFADIKSNFPLSGPYL